MLRQPPQATQPMTMQQPCRMSARRAPYRSRIGQVVSREARDAHSALALLNCVNQTGHRFLRFPFRPWYRKKEEPSFSDLLTTLRRVSYDEKTERLLPKRCGLKTWIAQITELLSRAG